MSPDASASCLQPTFDLLEPRILLSGFTAYNDTVAGPLTGEYTTLYADNGGAAAGQLRDVATGAYTPVILTTIGVGVGFGGTGANPADGTPADVIFGGYIDFTSAWGSNAIEMSGSATYTYRFENLDPGSTYDFAGTAIRGSDSYTDRWTLVTLLGVDPDSFTTAHSSGDGIYTAGLAANQVALWTGANHLSSQGFVVQWLDIDPGADGEFEVVSQQYTGLIPTSVDPAGVADGNKGYGLNGVRLIENVPSAPPTVVTTPATNVEAFSAVIGGEVTSTGGETPNVRLYFGDHDGGAVHDDWDGWVDLGPLDGPFAELAGGLSPGTTYFYRAFAENSVGAAWAPTTESFTTLTASAPAVINLPATDVGAFSARLGGEVTDTGNDSPLVTIYYGNNDGGTALDAWDHSIELDVQSGEFWGLVDDLEPETTYYYTAHARNAVGGAWATPSLLFQTVAAPPLEITEFMADNATTLLTRTRSSPSDPFVGDYQSPDWIEIHNPTDAVAILDGFYLSDDLDNLDEWRFPAGTSIAPGGHLIVFASGDSITNPLLDEHGYLHADFKLADEGGEDVVLADAGGDVVFAYESYPTQIEGTSYGIDADGEERYFPQPTPGWDNANDVPQEPRFSVASTTFVGSIVVDLAAAYPTDTIHYTLDESVPTVASPVWTGPKTFTESTMLRAVSISTSSKSSRMVSETYLALSEAVASASSNLPLVIVQTFGDGVLTWSFGDTFMAFFEPGADGRAWLTNPMTVATRAGIHIRGSSSAGFWKKQYRVEFWDEANEDRKVELLGMPAEADWIFYGPGEYDRALINNPFIYDLSNQVGRYALRTTWVEMYLDAGGGVVTASDYVGVYAIMEVVEAGDDRVDVEPLSSGAGGIPVHGGFIWKNDRGSPYVEPEAPNSAQTIYINNYISSLEAAASGSNFRDPVLGYAAWADADSFVDHNLLNMLAMNVDAMRLSGYYFKTEDGKLEAGPIFDFDRALESTDGRDDNPYWWNGTGDSTRYFNDDSRVRIWWPRMFQDPDFVQRYIDRWFELRQTVFSLADIYATIDAHAALLQEAAPRDYARWYTPRFGGFAGEIQHLKDWLTNRINWIDSQWLAQPTPDVAGPVVTPGTPVTLSAPVGTIYYTLDGTDPRAAGGVISAGAVLAQNPITIDGDMTLTARVYQPNRTPSGGPPGYIATGDDWSAPLVAEYCVNPLASAGNVVVTEVHYHPADPTFEELATQPPGDPDFEDNDFEFVELMNVGTEAVNLAGAQFTGGIAFTFPSFPSHLMLEPGHYVVVVKNLAAFEARYDTTGITVVGPYDGRLDNAGERIEFRGRFGELIQAFTYEDDWYPESDGAGFSLAIINPFEPDLDTWNDPDAWRLSVEFGGSPGKDNQLTLPPDAVVINEVLSHTDASPVGDWIELYNATDETIDIGGWYLSDDGAHLMKYRIADGTEIAGYGYLVFSQAEHFGDLSDPGCLVVFQFSELGEEARLTSVDDEGQLAGYRQTQAFGAAEREVTFGRYTDSAGRVDFVAMSEATKEGPNALPLVGPVVISEIMYHPAEAGDEFIELHNLTGADVALYDEAHPANTWYLSGGVDYAFATGTVIPANGYLLVVEGDPAVFREKYAVPAEVEVLGPYTGSLNNGGETVRSYRPGEPEPDDTVPYILVERVKYDDAAPWPVEADGQGPSLQRTVSTDYGNDPANWHGGPAEGTPGVVNGSTDVTPPRLVGAQTVDGAPYKIVVTFSETLDPVSAKDPANYAVDQGISVLGVVSGPDDRTVVVVTSPLSNPTTYTLTINGVRNAAGIAVVPDRQASFTYDVVEGTGTILREYWTGIPGTYVSDLTGSASYPSNPTGMTWETSLEAPTDWGDDYGTRMRGYLLPPATGQYQFWIAANARAELWLSTDDSAANRQKIAWAPDYTSQYEWTKYASQQSMPIELEAGNRYYIEVLHKEGGGSDHMAVRWLLSDGFSYETPIPGNRLAPYAVNPLMTVSIEATAPNAAEAGPVNGTFTVARTGSDVSLPLTVYYTVDGTAGAGDYAPLTGSVVIPADETEATIEVAPVDDGDAESDETVVVLLSSHFLYSVGMPIATVTIADDDALPYVTAVALNPAWNRPVRGVSAIEPSGIGVRTIEILFSEPVTFAASDVQVLAVEFNPDIGGTAEEQERVGVLPAVTVTGSGTNVMLITLGDPLGTVGAVDTWVKVRLLGGGTLVDLQGHALDGEAKAGGSGRDYLYDGTLDLPTGDGTAGGDAVFYVGSLRGDFRKTIGTGTSDGRVTSNDVNGFLAVYREDAVVDDGNLDADFRKTIGTGGPDGKVTSNDVNGFLAVYREAVAEGRRLYALPSTVGPLGTLTVLSEASAADDGAAAAGGLVEDAWLDPVAALLRVPTAAGVSVGSSEPAGIALPAAVPVLVSGSVSGGLVAAPVASAAVPVAAASSSEASSVLTEDGELVDLLSLTALELPLEA